METQTINIGEQTFTCEVARTPEQRQHGLMNRKTLTPEQGMLFVFEKPDIHTFWMKDTPLALDIIWIDEKDLVSEFVTATPCDHTPCEVYQPQKIAKYVLEVPAGEFRGKIGDKFEITK